MTITIKGERFLPEPWPQEVSYIMSLVRACDTVTEKLVKRQQLEQLCSEINPEDPKEAETWLNRIMSFIGEEGYSALSEEGISFWIPDPDSENPERPEKIVLGIGFDLEGGESILKVVTPAGEFSTQRPIEGVALNEGVLEINTGASSVKIIPQGEGFSLSVRELTED